MRFAPLLLAAVLLLATAASAEAHRLNVFAWLENDRIIVECDFGKDRPARNASVTIYDSATKKALLHGQTGQNGQYVFAVPEVVREGHGLVIDVNSGQGHRGEWTMDASELYAAASLTAGFDASAIEARQQGEGAPAATPTPPTIPIEPVGSGITPEHIRGIVHEAVEANIAPLRRQLAEREGPGIVEIIGGVGWIIGLVGLYLIFRSRRKSS